MHAKKYDFCLLIAFLLLAFGLIQPPPLPAQTPKVQEPQRFQSTEEAVDALARAVAGQDRSALTNIFGSQADALLGPADDLAAPAEFEAFDRAFKEAHELVKIGDYQALLIGQEGWPLPIPLAQDQGQWYFDTEAGLSELAVRRLGRNELDAMEVCLAYFDAQRDYYQLNPGNSPIRHYARFFVSKPGHKDGLYWESENADDPVSPLGQLMALAADQPELVRTGNQRPYHGYYYKILTSQGPNAPGGAWDYLEDGRMIGGFALLAYPAEYGVTGVMSFIVNQSGQVYEKDLGPKSRETAAEMDSFDPDSSWKRLDESNESQVAVVD